MGKKLLKWFILSQKKLDKILAQKLIYLLKCSSQVALVINTFLAVQPWGLVLSRVVSMVVVMTLTI